MRSIGRFLHHPSYSNLRSWLRAETECDFYDSIVDVESLYRGYLQTLVNSLDFVNHNAHVTNDHTTLALMPSQKSRSVTAFLLPFMVYRIEREYVGKSSRNRIVRFDNVPDEKYLSYHLDGEHFEHFANERPVNSVGSHIARHALADEDSYHPLSGICPVDVEVAILFLERMKQINGEYPYSLMTSVASFLMETMYIYNDGYVKEICSITEENKMNLKRLARWIRHCERATNKPFNQLVHLSVLTGKRYRLTDILPRAEPLDQYVLESEENFESYRLGNAVRSWSKVAAASVDLGILYHEAMKPTNDSKNSRTISEYSKAHPEPKKEIPPPIMPVA
jgi:hypothetical protein